MNDDRTLERAARSWLEEGPTQAPDRAVDAAIARIQTTSQERELWLPWRSNRMNRFAIPAAAALVVVLAAVLLIPRLASDQVGPQPSSTSEPTLRPSPSPRLDYSDLGGRILVEHLGNAIDESEMPTTEYHPERRRLYFLDPATMSRADAVEFLPGQPPTGKLHADVSLDGTKVVFMDRAENAQVWIANLDGTGLRLLSEPCDCSELDPAFDPTGTKVVYVHLENGHRNSGSGANLGHYATGPQTRTWLEIRDIASGEVTVLDGTMRTAEDAWPAQPDWSPDGTRIVFDRITWLANELAAPTGLLQIVEVSSGDVTDLPFPGHVPGDADWSPDGAKLLFGDYPISQFGSIGETPPLDMYTVNADGTGLTDLIGGAGGSWLPDGRILYQSNNLRIMNADGSGALEVARGSNDLTELAFGFVYVSHWVPDR